MVRAVLVSLRDPHDVMAEHERMCFAECASVPVSEIQLHHIAKGMPSIESLKTIGTVFFGGSGAYSVLDQHQWIEDTIALMLQVVDKKIPAYASCFGFQGLAKALGGVVKRDDDLTEMGSFELELTPDGEKDSLFSSLPTKFWAQEGHHDHVIELPKGVTLLAKGHRVHAQAFRVDGAPFWASQFHPELNYERTLERFQFYSDHYLGSDEASSNEMFQNVKGGPNSEEVPQLLARLIRKQY